MIDRFTLFNFYHREANSDGRASGFVTWEQFEPVVYKMKFDIKEYFQSKNISTFYPYAEVLLNVCPEHLFQYKNAPLFLKLF